MKARLGHRPSRCRRVGVVLDCLVGDLDVTGRVDARCTCTQTQMSTARETSQDELKDNDLVIPCHNELGGVSKSMYCWDV